MRFFSFRSLLTFSVGLVACLLILVVFSDRPTALNTRHSDQLTTTLPVSNSEEILLPLAEIETSAPTVAHTPGESENPESSNALSQIVKVKKGDSLSSIFLRLQLPQADLLSIQEVCPTEWQNQSLNVGQTMKFQRDDQGSLKTFEFHKDRLTRYVFTRTDDTFTAEIRQKKVIATKTYRHVKIERGQSVISAGLANGVRQEKTVWRLPKLLQWDLDFYHDIHPGDSYEILYFENFVDGEYIGDGEIVALRFHSGKTTHQIIQYRGTEDDRFKYYSRDGTSTEGQFLRAPLEYTRVSSEFSPRRLHPIYKKYMPHNGIDYAAPTGTPVYATGTGIVTQAGHKRLNGNYVVLKHGTTFQTKYLHLHKIDPKVKVGAKVSQGQRIGSVGMTGAATGPHLHYEFLVDGKHQNPKTVHLPRTAALTNDELIPFQRHADKVFDLMASFQSQFQKQEATEEEVVRQ